MIKVYSHENIVQVHHIKNLLESNGIECAIKNEAITSLAGEVPMTECWPQVWLNDDNEKQRSLDLIFNYQEQDQNKENWTCTSCKENIESEFDICWNCGGSR